MKSYATGDSLVLQQFRDGDVGLRPSYQRLLSLIDASDPSWPKATEVLREMADSGVEIDETALAIAMKVGAHRLAVADEIREPSRRSRYDLLTLATSGSIVYYVRRGDLIKIGTTTAPVQRFTDLMPDAILAFEPGTVRDETCRHRQFSHLCYRGEYFRPAAELMEHVCALRRLHGDPDPSWPNMANPKRSADPAPLPHPLSDIRLTVPESAIYLGINQKALRMWVNRRKISAAGCNERGVTVYHVEHLVALRDKA